MLPLDHLYHMDCLEGMKLIPDHSVDAIITDLPYGTTKNAWDSLIPLDLLWSEYRRIIKPRGAIVLFSQMPFTAVLAMSNLEWLRYEWIWQKEQGTGQLNSGFAPMKNHENILVFSPSGAAFCKDPEKMMVYHPQYRTGKAYTVNHRARPSTNYDVKHQHSSRTVNDGQHYMPLTILPFKRDKDAWHPTQKPIDLLRYLVLTYTSPGDIVLDSTSGSATTLRACIREHRHFIGFEINEEYYRRAQQDIEREQLMAGEELSFPITE